MRMKPTAIKRRVVSKGKIALKGNDITEEPRHLQIPLNGGYISMPLGDNVTWSNVRDMILELFEVATARKIMEKHEVTFVKEGKGGMK